MLLSFGVLAVSVIMVLFAAGWKIFAAWSFIALAILSTKTVKEYLRHNYLNMAITILAAAVCVSCFVYTLQRDKENFLPQYHVTIADESAHEVENLKYYCAQITSITMEENILGMVFPMAEFNFGPDIQPNLSASHAEAIRAQANPQKYCAGDIVILKIDGYFKSDLSWLDTFNAEVLGLRDVLAPEAELGHYDGPIAFKEIIRDEVNGKITRWSHISPTAVTVSIEGEYGVESYMISIDEAVFAFDVGDMVRITTHCSEEGIKEYRISSCDE